LRIADFYLEHTRLVLIAVTDNGVLRSCVVLAQYIELLSGRQNRDVGSNKRARNKLRGSNILFKSELVGVRDERFSRPADL
jgi:hypothetical protein